MGKESEFKFLVQDTTALHLSDYPSARILQGYLTPPGISNTVRVRIAVWDNGMSQGYITVKGPKEGITCSEYEYEIPFDDAEQLLQMCYGGVINKRRYIVPNGDYPIELDVFGGHLNGLVIAEIEVKDASCDLVTPYWIRPVLEISEDHRYSNISLLNYGIPKR